LYASLHHRLYRHLHSFPTRRSSDLEISAYVAHLPHFRFALPIANCPLAAIIADLGDAWEHEANRAKLVCWYWNGVFGELYGSAADRKSTRLNSSHVKISYAVFCLKK